MFFGMLISGMKGTPKDLSIVKRFHSFLTNTFLTVCVIVVD